MSSLLGAIHTKLVYSNNQLTVYFKPVDIYVSFQ